MTTEEMKELLAEYKPEPRKIERRAISIPQTEQEEREKLDRAYYLRVVWPEISGQSVEA